MYFKFIAVVVGAICASAQTTCPPIHFLNAKTIELDATSSSHLVAVRQSDGSYTAFEMANASPYTVLRSIPHFEQRFSSCLPRVSAHSSSSAAGGPVAVAQPAAFAVLDSGNYLFVSGNRTLSLDVAVFDPRLQLISENQVATFPFDQPSPGSYGAYLSLILTDVNGDGKLDVVAQYEFVHDGESFGDGGGIRVLLGDGRGGFQLVDDFPLGNVNGSMAVGDLNGDGRPDLVIGAPQDPAQQASALIVALGKGDGTFTPASLSTPNEVGPGAIVIADINGDGKNDIVSLTSALTPTSQYPPNEVAVRFGKGDGTFSSPTIVPVQAASPDSVLDDAGTPGALAVGDVNGDGNLDIVTNGITILLGDGKGGFPNRKDFLNTAPESVILADFDGDGKTDVLIGTGNSAVLSGPPPFSEYQENSLTVFFGEGTGDLTAAPVGPSPVQTSSSFSSPNSADYVTVASGDFNQDGLADLAMVSVFQYLSIFVTSASGTLTHVSTYDFAAIDKDASPTSVAAADFNGDGIIDLAVSVARRSSPGSIEVFTGVGDGTFLPPVASSAPASTTSLVVGDFNKDGHPDVAAIDVTGSTDGDRIAIFLNQGDGTFAPPQSYPAGTLATSLAIGDFNRDGVADIAIGNYNSIQLLLGKGDGTFSQGLSISFPDGVPGRLAAADLNGDGKLDLVAGAAILLGHGDGTFASAVIYSSGAAPGFGDTVAVGDFNGDGILDVCLSTSGFLIGNGDGTFQLQTTDAPGGSVIAADFNGDGKLDISSGFIVPGDPIPQRAGTVILFNQSSSATLMSVVSAADFSYGPMAPHSIASAFGKHLALTTASANAPSLPTTLGGTSVSMQDQIGTTSSAEIYYASPGQVNFVLPQSLEAGTALVTITTTDGQSATSEIQISDQAPKLFTVDPSGIPAGYAVRVGPGNVQTVEPIFTGSGGHIKQVPIDLSQGDVYLVLFGTGFDTPPNNPLLEIGNMDVTASYIGPQSQYPGLDQLNILLPKSLAGLGMVDVELSGANIVYITIK